MMPLTPMRAMLLRYLCVLCLCRETLATYTAPIDNKYPGYLKTIPNETSWGLASDWQFCQSECANDSVCLVFTWSSRRQSCHLYPPEMAFTHGVQEFMGTAIGTIPDKEAHIQGRIDRTSGDVVWLSLGRPTMAQVAYRLGAVGSLEECQAMCDTNDHMVPCLGTTLFQWYVATAGLPDCVLYAGFGDDPNEWEDDPLYDQTTTMVNPPVDPTGNGTRITAENLPPAPPNIMPIPFTLTDITAKAFSVDHLVFIAESWGEATWSDCSQKCHDNAACRSFQWYENGHAAPDCRLYDIAITGTFVIGRATYGIIDRDQGSNAVKYKAPTFYQTLQPVILSAFESVTTLEECAAKCYHFHQPIYCTSFQLDHDASRCLLFSINIEYWTPSSVSLPVAGNVQMGVINGRRPYNHYHDHGEPAQQLVTLPLPPVVIYKDKRGHRSDTTAVKVVPIKTQKDKPTDIKRLRCSMACFAERGWCTGYDVDIDNHVCRLYDSTMYDAASQLAHDDQDTFYGNP